MLGDDHYAIFKSDVTLDTEKMDVNIKQFGLVSKIKFMDHAIKADFLNKVMVPCINN